MKLRKVMKMDLYDFFENKEESLKKILIDIEKIRDTPESESTWDIFKKFIIELIKDSDDFKRFLLAYITDPYEEKKDFYEELEIIFNLLHYEDRFLEKIIYSDGRNRVSIDYDKINDSPVM